MSFVDYRKYFSEMRGGAYRGIKILSAPIKPKVDVRLSEDNQRDIHEVIDKTDKSSHSSLVLFGHKDSKKARLINHIAYESGRSVCFISCDDFARHYIGETEKNLSGLFARAESEGWIFFLYRADVLFANDKDDNEISANNSPEHIDTYRADRDYLMTRMAQYPSAVVLSIASNAALELLRHRVDYLIT